MANIIFSAPPSFAPLTYTSVKNAINNLSQNNSWPIHGILNRSGLQTPNGQINTYTNNKTVVR